VEEEDGMESQLDRVPNAVWKYFKFIALHSQGSDTAISCSLT
jgi:hypothetical protein